MKIIQTREFVKDCFASFLFYLELLLYSVMGMLVNTEKGLHSNQARLILFPLQFGLTKGDYFIIFRVTVHGDPGSAVRYFSEASNVKSPC